MTVPGALATARPQSADQIHSSGGGQTLSIAWQDPSAALIDYRGLDFKEMLAACPVDGLDLERKPEPPRPVAV